MRKIVDNIIVSSDESYFLQYWPVVVKAWNKFFPEATVHLAFVTERTDDDDLVKNLRKIGSVHLFKEQDSCPTANQAKVARHILAGMLPENEISMIEDIDTIPLQREYFEKILSQRRENTMLFVGKEVLENTEHAGKIPASNMAAESKIYREFYNSENLNFEEFIEAYLNIRIHDSKEAIANPAYHFSDESLTRVFTQRAIKSNKDIFSFAKRDVDIKNDWIDRSWWNINLDKLNSEKYVTCNFLRPPINYWNEIHPIYSYIFGHDMSNLKNSALFLG